jgi:predicted NBD/HSP70 family sugar kinase
MYEDPVVEGGREAPQGVGPVLPTPLRSPSPLRRQVFDYVRAHGRAARADVARALGISAASVTALTADLIALGLLREVDVPLEREAGRGRPPVALEIVPEGRQVVGIKLGDERHTAVLSDFGGRMLAEAARPAAPGRRPLVELLDEVEALVADLRAASPGREAMAVGIGLPGLVEHGSGRVAWSPLLRETGAAVAEACAVRLGRPVGMGMELGHLKVELDGALCRCGQRGCLEAYISDYALAREAATALGRDPRQSQSPRAMLETLFGEAKAGHEAAREIFARAGRHLALGLSNLVQLFDPGLIILSGERMRYDFLYADEVLSEMQRLVLPGARPPVRVEVHAWGDLVWAQGAAALALSAATDAVLA